MKRLWQRMQVLMDKLERVLQGLAEMCDSAGTARKMLPTLGSVEPSKPLCWAASSTDNL
jgi:hypothetical protein